MEVALRLVSVICGLIVLPAVYRLASRVGGTGVAVACVVILGLSTWEVEISRFGRMYAPFQAIFAWYLWFSVRNLVDGHAPSRWCALGLSLLGLVTWEGGVLLLALNLLLLFVADCRPERSAQRLVFGVATAAVFLLGALYTRTDFLRMGVVDALPPGFSPQRGGPSPPDGVPQLWEMLSAHPVWWMGWLMLAALAIAVLARAALENRARPLAVGVLALFLLG